MGFLDELKDKAEAFGEKAKDSFGGATDQTENVIENVKDRFDKDDTPAEKAGEAVDSSTEAVSDAAEGMNRPSPTPPIPPNPPLRPRRTPSKVLGSGTHFLGIYGLREAARAVLPPHVSAY